MTNTAPPVLQAQATAHGWRVWCDYYRRWHHHSAGPGHRVAHCTTGSPYKRTGYILELAASQ